MRNSWSRQHCLSLFLGGGSGSQEAGELCSGLVTDLWSKLPSPSSFPAALQHLLAYATDLSSLSSGSCICAWFHAALMTLNLNHAAAWPIGEMVTGDPFTNPSVSFSLRCKFRVGHAGKAKLAVSAAFQKHMRILACCVPCLPGSERRAHVWHVFKVYCALQASPFFSSLGYICCSCSGKHQSGGRKDSGFSAWGSNVGKVSLKVIWSQTLSILSPSLEISRKKYISKLGDVFGFAEYKVRALWPCSEQRRSWWEWDPRKSIMQSKSRWRNMNCIL